MKYIFTFLVGCIIFCSSCASVAYIKKTENEIAPNLKFSDKIQKVYLLNRSREKNLITRMAKSWSSGIIGGDELSDSRLVLMKDLARGYYKNTKYIGEDKRGHSDRPAEKITQGDIEKRRGDSDALLCLEQYKIEESRTYESINKHQLDELGNDVYIQAMHGIREVKLQTYWRLYDSQSGLVISEFPKEITRITETESINKEALDIKLDTINVITSESLSKLMAAEMLTDLNPTYIRSSWMYHIKGHDAIKASGKFIKQKRYAEAIQILKKYRLLESSDNEIMYKAYYNASVASYLSDDIERAIKYAKEGYKRTSNSNLTSLIKKINGY